MGGPMTPGKRVVLAVSLTLLVVALTIGVIIVRVRHAHVAGVAGVVFLEPTGAKNQPKVFGLRPSQIMMVYPDGPADQAGLRPRDEIVSIGGVSLLDKAGLRKLNERVKTGDPVTYRIRRNGQERDVVVRFRSPFDHPYPI